MRDPMLKEDMEEYLNSKKPIKKKPKRQPEKLSKNQLKRLRKKRK